MPDSFKHRQIGPHSHARWLNLANRLCRIFCCDHQLSPDDTAKLTLLVSFIAGVYAPMWFNIKIKHKWTEGPNHILKQLQLVRDQDKKVRDVVEPFIKSTAWNSHPEAVLQSMLSSDEQGLRDFAIGKIMQIRNDAEIGDKSARFSKCRRST